MLQSAGTRAGRKARSRISDLIFSLGDGTNVISTGAAGNYIGPFDFGFVIVGWSIVARQSGSISIDVWKCTYSQFDSGGSHPVAGDKISASAPITFTTTTKAQSSSVLAGWSPTVNPLDILAFNVASVTTCTAVVITLKISRAT